MFSESRTRSLFKTLSWRVTATLATIGLVYAFTGEIAVALSVGSIEVFAKLALFYLHERVWDNISFGRKPQQEVSQAVEARQS